jgi:hypothetical protein
MPTSGTMPEPRCFPPPWSVDGPDMRLGQDCYIVRDANGHVLAYATLDASGFKLTRVRLLLAKPTKYQAET